ncbi:MAG: aspartate--tRNA(Asn) ligase, partial [Firmicutes bacterium]|nr:aspartate--tRNA(Asn) ligase [Bacillota bacterium]
MKRVLVSELSNHRGAEVMLRGWVYRIRELSKVTFLVLRDRTGMIQVAMEPSLLGGVQLSVESVVEIRGVVRNEPRAALGYEIEAHELKVLALAEALPISVNGPTLEAAPETILDYRVLSLRHAKTNPIFKIQAALVRGFQMFLDKEGFLQIFTPKIVASGTEGGTELFSLQYFETKAYLAQSPQFYKQMMIGAGYERVYEVGQVYRAEKHSTSRHLNEYVSLDLELAFIDNEHDIMDLQNRLLAFMFEYVLQECSEELEELGVNLPSVPTIPRIPLLEAIEILEREYGKIHEEPDLDPEGERLLNKYILDITGSEFVYVTDYPWAKRPMYTMPKGEGLTRSFDLLFRGLEITTGGQRIHTYELLEANMIKKGLNPQDYSG